jgi:hypothetical protein
MFFRCVETDLLMVIFSTSSLNEQLCFESFCSSKFCALIKKQISQLKFSLFHEHLNCELLLI